MSSKENLKEAFNKSKDEPKVINLLPYKKSNK